MAARAKITHASFCAGGAGIDLGLRIALGDRLQTILYVERESFAAATLVARMEEKALDDAPVWDDLTTFDGRPWRGLVDIFSAGFPCQPWSCAGEKNGIEDARWIWPALAQRIREMEPAVVFLENVRGLVSGGGLEHVLNDLAQIGYDAEWDDFSAADVGASHRRERIFILAQSGREFVELQQRDLRPKPAGASGVVGDATRFGERESNYEACAKSRGEPRARFVSASSEFADTQCSRLEGCRGEPCHDGGQREAIERSGLPLFPPGPNEREQWAEVLEVAPHLEPSVCRVSAKLANRVDRLRLLGNGVVPLVASVAFSVLAARAKTFFLL